MTNLTLTEEQSKALKEILAWFKEPGKQTLTLGGYAGTGKTTLLKFLAEELSSKQISFMSFTGKAVAVMRSKMPKFSPSTIHSFMYKAITDANGVVIEWKKKDMAESLDSFFDPTYMAPYSDLIVIDEASMVPEDIYQDLLAFNKPILAIGDHGQLPPINGIFSLMANPDLRLETIHRQAEDNPIIRLATMIREGNAGWTGSQMVLPKTCFNGSRAESLVSNPSPDSLFIVGTNKERIKFNKAVLAKLYNGLENVSSKPQANDRIICLKNNHNFGIYNGMQATVIESKKAEDYPEHNLRYLIKPDGEDFILDLHITKYLFLNYSGLLPEDVKFYEIKERFDYAYALTCHKAQGSEAKNVIVWGSGFGDRELRRRWLYTAVTRAKENLYVFI